MIILILFAFIGGIITILSPCILPVLPIVLSGSFTGGKRRPLGIVTGFILSFTFFTLFLSAIVRATGLSGNSLRYVAVFVLFTFGLTLLIPKLQLYMEKFFSKLTSRVFPITKKQNDTSGFFSGIPVGASLGLLWTPCVGPILASVITLAATSQINATAAIITVAYATGTAIPLLAITYGGRQLLNKIPYLFQNLGKIQKAFGIIMIITSIGIYFNVDRSVQTAILTAFPQYGAGLTFLEDNDLIKKELERTTTNSLKNSESNIGKPMEKLNSGLPVLRKAPGFQRAAGEWINSEPLMLENLRGKVVLIDFWTYTCINCIRTLPYMRTWYEKYNDQGLIIVGVHTPEFEFEKSSNNVKKAVRDFGLLYPIVQDNDFGIWQDYNNRYWPAKYLIDKNGNIRYTHFGEGAYDQTEQAIQELLKETGVQTQRTIDNPRYTINTTTPELYLGSARIDHLVSPEKVMDQVSTDFSPPKTVPLNYFAFEGRWTISREYAKPTKGSKLILHFGAKEVFLVMRPKDNRESGSMKIMLGQDVVNSNSAGDDLNEDIVRVTDDRLYKLIRLEASSQDILTLEFLDDNIELYAFTFG